MFLLWVTEYIMSLESVINEIGSDEVSIIVQACYPSLIDKALM